MITNYSYRHLWVQGVDKFEFNENEVTRIGTEHVCVINNKHLNFIVVTKEGKPGQLVYGELTTSPAFVDELYQFYIINPLTQNSCKLEIEAYWKVRSPLKKLVIAVIAKRIIRKNIHRSLHDLLKFVENGVI